jgi:hypothetical protein
MAESNANSSRRVLALAMNSFDGTGSARSFSHGAARARVSEVKIIRNTQRSKDLSKQVAAQAAEVRASEAFRSMCTAKQYRATATQYKERADRATAPDEKREYQDLERSFSTLADNEQWLSSNHDKTVHARERPSVSTASVPMRQYLLRARRNSPNPSLLKAAKP